MESIEQRLCLLFTPAACAGDPNRTLAAAIDGGVDLVQWRVRPPDREGAARCLAACTARGVPLIVNDHVELAVAIGAAGAHVGQDDLAAARARALLGPDRLLGVSTHDDDQLRRAIEAGADYVGFGPCFPTATKGYVSGQPAGALAAAIARATVPVFAIGGITPANVGAVVEAGARHIAVSAAILGAGDPAAAARALRAALG